MRLELEWGNLHRLILSDDDDPPTVTLSLVKGGGAQRIPVALPPDVTLAQVSEAWAAQGGKWAELFEYKGPPFFATRVIWLPGRQAICWSLLHEGDAPHDTCGIIPLDKDAWTHGKIEAAPKV